jgi:hypothetical protein
MDKIDKVIEYFRNLREESSPTMNTGSGSAAGFSGYANSAGPNAGFDPVMKFKKRRNGKIDGRSASGKYKTWLRSMGLL